MVEVGGRAAPAAAKIRWPGFCGPTTVTLADTDTARVEMPHSPAKVKTRFFVAASEGAPKGPPGPRVSSTRHGFTV
jgi:hypothetical protein